MILLDAVNEALTALGEHPVTTIEGKNPSVSVVLRSIETTNKRLQTRGWYFNQFDATLYPGTDGVITMPKNTIGWRSDTQSYVSGNQLVCSRTLSRNWRNLGVKRVEGTVTAYVPFEDLPESFAQYVLQNAIFTAYINDFGVEDTAGIYRERAKIAESEVIRDNLRHRNFSTSKSRTFRSIERHLWR